MTETVSYIKDSLKETYPPGEITGFTRLIMEHVCGLQPHRLLMCKGKELSGIEKERVREIVFRLKKSEPIQYILGETTFYGLPFLVNPSVLIPRPETEELADLIVKQYSGRKIRLLDIGTGSGCIAVSLAKHLPDSEVTAIDISEKALETARLNAEKNNVTISFLQTDILDRNKAETVIHGDFDLIVSNPPYVLESEKASMQENVLLYEPATALYVPDNDPLLFYRAIAGFASDRLKAGGSIYLEINARYGKQLIELLAENGYKNIELLPDLSGKDRIIKAFK